jgi:hypothetical protein
LFAIVIPLLVLELHTPAFGYGNTDRKWSQALVDLLPHFGASKSLASCDGDGCSRLRRRPCSRKLPDVNRPTSGRSTLSLWR